MPNRIRSRSVSFSRLPRMFAAPTWLVVALAFGLLLWARFLLVTGHPRTAIAEPPARGIQASPAVAAHDQP